MNKPTWYATQVYDGKTYETVEDPNYKACNDCAFEGDACALVSKGCITNNYIWKEIKMNVEVGKTYLTPRNKTVRIICIDRPGPYPVVGLIDDFIATYTTEEAAAALTERSPWMDVKVDTPIWVLDATLEDFIPRHFAKFENGLIYAWGDGKTSHTYKHAHCCKIASLTNPKQ